jgi:hypothetical protein
MRHFLQYWRTYSPEIGFGKPLTFAASAHFVRLQPDDVLWIVALKERRPTLLGRLEVATIENRENAVKQIGEDTYEAPLYALAKKETVHDLMEVDIQQLAARLRFNSVKDRLNLPDPDCTNGQQLQTMRELTPETASLLQTVLHSNGKHGGTT